MSVDTTSVIYCLLKKYETLTAFKNENSITGIGY